MKKSAPNLPLKARKLLRLYSLWQETRRQEIQQQCLALLGEIMVAEPDFRLRDEFKRAF